MVADGMGGHAAGEVASALAIATVHAQVCAGHRITDAIQFAHQRVLYHGHISPEQAGMGTTIVAAHRRKLHLALAWVGDSRIYQWRFDTQVNRPGFRGGCFV